MIEDATDIIEGYGFVRIEPGQDGLYVVGRLTERDDSMWWKVIQRKPGEPLYVIAGYASREDAIKVRDAFNAAPLLRDGAIVRREESRRIAEASEAQP